MDEDSAPDSVSSAYMLIMEHLMLFTAIRLLWHHTDKNVLSDTLFIKDGPLTLRSQYSKLVGPIREFLQYAKETGRAIHIVGQEKSGAFFDHLASIVLFAAPHARGERAAYAALSHDYVRRGSISVSRSLESLWFENELGRKTLREIGSGCLYGAQCADGTL
jgi:hypothetical protein